MVRHGFVGRVPDVAVALAKDPALAVLRPWHEAAVRGLGFSPARYFTAEQVHGAAVAVVPNGPPQCVPQVDGLMTNVPGVLLGIHVADCAAIYLVDPGHSAIALLHSGKNGSALGIVKEAISAMQAAYGTRAQDLIVQVAPCIRPPAYEVDFPAQIHIDALAAGVPPSQYHDCAQCTAAAPTLYYSYRREHGQTGRMLALLGIPSPP